MKRVFIIHGFGGVPDGGWFPWLLGELAEKNIPAVSLTMPHTNEPIVSEWVETIAKNVSEIQDEVILVGHSLGVPAVLRYLETLPTNKRIYAVVLVSGFIMPLQPENRESDFRKIDVFVDPAIDLENVRAKIDSATVIHGRLDTIVPFSHAEIISKGLGAELVEVKQGDHFSQKTEPICRALPQALEAIVSLLPKA
jgi:predicted alpha/beta hydrolase family esterase